MTVLTTLRESSKVLCLKELSLGQLILSIDVRKVREMVAFTDKSLNQSAFSRHMGMMDRDMNLVLNVGRDYLW